MWIYGILGAVTGITNDAALSYYKIVAPHLISGLNIFNAATAILMSIIIATVHKWGYRKILFILPPMTAIFMALTCVTTNQFIIMIAYAIVGVIDGLFTEFYLFNTPNGYANAYYIAAVIYVIASVLLLVFFAKKYNRILDDENKKIAWAIFPCYFFIFYWFKTDWIFVVNISIATSFSPPSGTMMSA